MDNMSGENRNEDIKPNARNQFREPRGGRNAWIGITFLIAVLGIAFAILQAGPRRNNANVPDLAPPRATTPVSAPSPVELSNTFREVSRIVKPAVVLISVVERPNEEADPSSPFGLPGPRRREGTGSGVIVTSDGYILTNEHVVGGASRINVTLNDGRRFKADVIGADPDTDLAVVKIDATDLPIAVLGDSDQLQQGDWVLALGNPFGLQQTLTAGIVSSTGRELRNSQFSRYIQTDASINPGNSGGPLVNMQGEVVGINTMILTGGQMMPGNIGIGFAIQSNIAREIYYQLARSGKVTRGYLGVYVTDLDQAMAEMVGLSVNQGVFVRDVTDANSPAGKAGLQSKDVITAINGKPVKLPRELTDTVAAMPVGATARVDFIRNGEPQTVEVTIAERPAQVTAQAVPERNDQPGGIQQGRLGIEGQTVTPEMADRLKLKRQTGVFVATVVPGGPAAAAGLMHGDVIYSFGSTQVSTIEELAAAVRSHADGDSIALEIERGGQIRFITVVLD
ncbi:MAG TPA: trypsin-like peptidase domain-containing protein [Blastocatellia bacterium]